MFYLYKYITLNENKQVAGAGHRGLLLNKKILMTPRASNGEQTEKPITETSLIADRMAG